VANEPPWVLVASGDVGRRMALFRLIERGGLRATVVDHGRDALAMLRDEPFDAVVLDVLEGELDAEAVLQRIRADPRLQRLPVFVTDHRSPCGPVPTQSSPDGAVGTSPESALRQRIDSCLAGQPGSTVPHVRGA
jgi:phosphoserine phosphatase RsbU/P